MARSHSLSVSLSERCEFEHSANYWRESVRVDAETTLTNGSVDSGCELLQKGFTPIAEEMFKRANG